MTDQQRCPVCAGRRKINRVSGRKMVREVCLNCRGTGKVPGQEPLVVPDSVIEEAAATAIDPLAEQRIIPSRKDLQLAVELAAPPIATWAREQGRTEGAALERDRMRTMIDLTVSAASTGSRPEFSEGVKAAVKTLLAALDALDRGDDR